MWDIIKEGLIIDARAGGLVIGRNDSEDDIPMIMNRAIGVFSIMYFMQGGEYILNKESFLKYEERLKEINSYRNKDEPSLISINLTNTTRVFNTNGFENNIFLFIEPGQFIVNRAATSKYYNELEKLNNFKQ